MTNFAQATLHALKVAGFIALAGAITSLVAWIHGNPGILLHVPYITTALINVVVAAIWKYFQLPGDPPVAQH